MEFIDLKAQQKRIYSRIRERIDNVLNHCQFVMGPEIYELEQTLADFVGVRHCISVASGTDSLIMSLMAHDIGPGDEVITTPFTFIASAEAISLVGATPVFVDIDEFTYNIDANLIASAVTERTKAILAVNLYGNCADYDEIMAVSDKFCASRKADGSTNGGNNRIVVIEDAAQSFGSVYKNRKSCSLSTIGCTSFFPAKPLGGYGEGGACFTNDSDLAERIRQLRNHGQEKKYQHSRIGLNGRMDTLQAAIILAKMEIFPEEIEARSTIARYYTEKFNEINSRMPNAVITQRIMDYCTSIHAQFTIRIDNRDTVRRYLDDHGIPTAVHYPIPIHKQAAFSTVKANCPVSENVAHEVLSLPMHAYLDVTDIDNITKVVADALLACR